MRFRPKSGTDSLDLLLDTICNTFGAIILIAILVAIITQNTATPNDVLQNTSAELIERQIANAEREIEEFAEIINSATSSSPDLAPLRAQAAQLDHEINLLENFGSSESPAPSSQAEAIASRIESDSAALKNAEAEAVSLENAIQTVTENSERLQSRLDTLKVSLEEIEASQRRPLRFPKERDVDRMAVWVMFRDNKIYPLYTSGIEPNRRDFVVTDMGHGARYEAIESGGRPLRSAQDIVAQFARSPSLGRDWYFACLVSPDSVEAFSAFRDAAVSTGAEYGWEPHDSRSVILTTRGGSKPPAL